MKVFDLHSKKLLLGSAIVLLLLLSFITFIISHSEKEPISETRFMLDTICTLTLHDWQGDGSEIIDGAFGICKKYDHLLSTTVSGSDIYNINHSEGKPVKVAEETAALIRRTMQYCEMSEGEFDITIYPAKSLWDFSGDNANIPDQKELAKAASKVDYTKVNINGRTVTVPKGMGIDLGAVAKGFIADRIAEYLKAHKVTSAIIDLGGNVYVLGSKPDGTNWRVGIRMPFANEEADVVETSNASVVTSGVYQRYFEHDGRIYHHILRSSDGMPCETGLYSVTIISKSSELCDALSTVCMLLGYEKSVSMLCGFSDVRAVFITSENQLLYYTP